MELNAALILLLTHGLPILFFAYMATNIMLRNTKKVEHYLISLIAICYLLLFAEEYVRNQVSIDYSPILTSVWLSNIGIVIIGLCYHFLVKFTGLYTRWPRFLYPYLFYLPLIFVVFNILTGSKLISAQEFVEIGMWKFPIYNTNYYIAMTVGIVTDLLYLIPLLIAKTRSKNAEQIQIYNELIIGIIIVICLHFILSYASYVNYLPPYPYLYIGIIWCYFLLRTMKKHDFLNLYDKRYEKLFNINPSAILLLDQKGDVQDVNPAAKQILASLQLQPEQVFHSLDQQLKESILAEEKIRRYPIDVVKNDTRFALLVDADYVWADNRLHVLLIFQDITLQKEYQEQTEFLAYHDALTSLPNRRLFNNKLENVLARCKEEQKSLAILLIDIDNFKLLNDSYGHSTGDEILLFTAGILQEIVNQHGLVARLGGDEFVLYIENPPAEQQIYVLVEQLKSTFSTYIAGRFGDLPTTISVGVSLFPKDGEDGQELTNYADKMMYETKRKVKAVIR